MMDLHFKFLIYFVLHWNLALGVQQHLVCKNIQDVFTDSGGSASVQRLPVALNESAIPGAQGIQGPRGPPGPPVVIDYGRIRKTIKDKVSFALPRLQSRFSKLETMYTDLNDWPVTEAKKNASELKAEQDKAVCDKLKGYYYLGKCYTISSISPASHMTHAEAVVECAKTEAFLAEFRDKAHQRELHDYAYSKLPIDRTSANLWIGMNYLRQKSVLQSRFGEEISVTNFQWRSSYPFLSYPYIRVELSNSYSTLILKNVGEKSELHGALCEKDI